MSSSLARPLALDLESFARVARAHPQLVRRRLREHRTGTAQREEGDP
jgi:hypothetical protein